MELESQGLVRDLVGPEDHRPSVKDNWSVHVVDGDFLKLYLQKRLVKISFKKFSLWILLILILIEQALLISIASSLKGSWVHLYLCIKHTVPFFCPGFLAEILHHLNDSLRVIVNAYHIVVLNHNLLVVFHYLLPVVLQVVDLAKLSDVLEELVCGAGQLGLEEGQPEDLGDL